MTTENKYCYYCKVEHPLTKEYWHGINTRCMCAIEGRKKRARYVANNKDKASESNKRAWEKNRDKRCAVHRLWVERNKDAVLNYLKEYRTKNKVRLATINKKNEQRRLKTDPYYRLVKNLRRRMLLVIQQSRTRKCENTFTLLGCNASELIRHIESKFTSGMTWDNHGLHGWHIDHVRPCASFDLTDPEQQRQCFHYTNLQPLWALDTIRKADKWKSA